MKKVPLITPVQVLASAGSSSPVPQDGLASVSYDQNTNRISTAGWEYDAAGNQTRARRADGSWQRYVYDAAGRLVRTMKGKKRREVVRCPKTASGGVKHPREFSGLTSLEATGHLARCLRKPTLATKGWYGEVVHGDTVILSGAEVTVFGVVSVTVTVNEKVPAAVGLPEITPVAVFNVNPGGSGPAARAHV